MQVTVDVAHDRGSLNHFWESMGFSPAELLLTPDMRQYVAYVGAVPHGGITHARIHYLLELVRVASGETGGTQYDWSLLDDCIDVLMGTWGNRTLAVVRTGEFTPYADVILVSGVVF